MYNDPRYSAITEDKFSPTLEIHFVDGDRRQVLVFEKVLWKTTDLPRSLRYGDNPGQAAALYRLINGNLVLGDVENIRPQNGLVSNPELLQRGKHPGKINISDADRALAHLRLLMDRPSVVMIKHGNPSGVAHADTIQDACIKAIDCDRVSSFGGCVGLNRPLDKSCADAILEAKADVVVAPDYEHGVLEVLSARPTLRVLRVRRIERLAEYAFQPVVDFTSLTDGGLIVQWTQVAKQISAADLTPATALHKGNMVRCRRTVPRSDVDDMLFAWKVVSVAGSNAVVFAKDGATVGIGTGQQDSITAVEVARDKAYRKLADHIALRRFNKMFASLDQTQMGQAIMNDVQELRGGLIGSIMASDAFFPAMDAVRLAAKEGVAGIIQPGGASGDHLGIEACNELGIPMVFTGERRFVG